VQCSHHPHPNLRVEEFALFSHIPVKVFHVAYSHTHSYSHFDRPHMAHPSECVDLVLVLLHPMWTEPTLHPHFTCIHNHTHNLTSIVVASTLPSTLDQPTNQSTQPFAPRHALTPTPPPSSLWCDVIRRADAAKGVKGDGWTKQPNQTTDCHGNVGPRHEVLGWGASLLPPLLPPLSGIVP
jgi:hypothetical protein